MVSLQMGSFSILIATVFLVFFVSTGEAIQCYECNSFNDSRCAQDVLPDSFKKECSEHKEGQQYSLCRKITQVIDFEVNGLKPDTRTIRACGWDRSNYVDRCYQRSGFGGRQDVCTCSTPYCNDGHKFQVQTAVLLLATMLQLIAAKYFF